MSRTDEARALLAPFEGAVGLYPAGLPAAVRAILALVEDLERRLAEATDKALALSVDMSIAAELGDSVCPELVRVWRSALLDALPAPPEEGKNR